VLCVIQQAFKLRDRRVHGDDVQQIQLACVFQVDVQVVEVARVLLFNHLSPFGQALVKDLVVIAFGQRN
jgi:hypothetical protein